MAKPRALSAWMIFAVPAVVAALSLIGLLGALIGDGVWNIVGWVGVAAPILVLIWARLSRFS